MTNPAGFDPRPTNTNHNPKTTPMQSPVQPTTQSKSPPLDPAEIIALAAMKAVGAVFLNRHLITHHHELNSR